MVRLIALLIALSAAPAWAALFALPTGVGSQNGTSLANACNGASDSDCSTNAAAGETVYLCDPGTGFTQSASWANANANANVRWTGDCSAYGYASRATIRNTSGAYNLNWTGAGSGTFDNIDFVGGHTNNTDCVNINGTGSLVFRSITVTGCTQDGVDIDSLTGGFIFTDLTISGAKFNGLFCNNSRVIGLRFVGDSVGTSGANNTDTIGIDDGCGPGTVISDIVITNQLGTDGGAIDLQDSTSSSPAIVRNFYVKNGKGAGYTATSNAGAAGSTAYGGIIDGFKFGVYLKDTAGTHSLSHITTINSMSTELKIGDTGTSGDSMTLADIHNSSFGGGSCATGDAATYWRNNASVTINLDGNQYCENGVFTAASGGNLTFAEWQAATSQEASSALTTDPGFVGGASPTDAAGFCLKSTSPLLNAGTWLGSWSRGYNDQDLGNPPTIGARGMCNSRARSVTRIAR